MMWNVRMFVHLLLVLQPVYGQQPELRQRELTFYPEKKNWTEARSFCRQNHVDLITIRDETENEAFKSYVIWLGLYREDESSPWKWSRDEEEANYLPWDSDEPDPGQNCGFKFAARTTWRNDGCFQKYSVLCHDEPLVLVKENKTWEESLIHCRSLEEAGSYDLATLVTDDDHDFARERAQEATTAEVWTGLRYLHGEWIWVGGEPVEYDDAQSCPAEGCGVLEKNSPAFFSRRDCSQRRNFLCYKKA